MGNKRHFISKMIVSRCTVIVFFLTQFSVHGHIWGKWKDLIKENSRENRKLTIDTRVHCCVIWRFPVAKLENLDGNELAEVFSGQYQGDMIISEKEMEDYRERKTRNDDLIDTEYRWDNGVVPYEIVESHFSNQSNGLANLFIEIGFSFQQSNKLRRSRRP